MLANSSCNMLLTGATGLIGGELAISLSQGGHGVWTLVRGAGQAEARERLARRLARSGQVLNGRLSPLPGDVHLPLCGILNGVARPLEESCEIVIHCAAQTSFRPDAGCWRTNVQGTQNLVDLVSRFKKLRRVFYVSSAVVCTMPAGGVVDEEASYAGFTNDYVASKRAAEKLLLESGLPVTILRPSVVISRGLKDRAFARSILWVLPLVAGAGCVPLRGTERLDIIPVDFVVKVISELLPTQPSYDCYHISAGIESCVTSAQIADCLHVGRHTSSPIRFNTAHDAVPSRFGEPLGRYLPFITADVVYSNKRLAHELGADFPECPTFSDYCLEMMNLVNSHEALIESALP